MKDVIRSAGCNELYTLEEINIDDDPIVRERYKYDIPVVSINGVETFMHRVTAEEFAAAIRSACKIIRPVR